MSTPKTRNLADIPEDVRTAHHEAGHAVAMMILGFQFEAVTILPAEIEGVKNATARGAIIANPQPWDLHDSPLMIRLNRTRMRDFVVVLFAGSAANQEWHHVDDEGGAADDLRADLILLTLYYNDEWDEETKIARPRADLARQAKRLIFRHKFAVRRLAQALLKRKTLTADEAAKYAVIGKWH